MNCQDYEILIQKSIDDELTDAERDALAAHLNDCPSCAALCLEYKGLDDMLKAQMPEVEVPSGLKESVMAALPEQEAAPAKNNRRRRTIISIVGITAAAAALVVAAGAAGMFSGEEESPGLLQVPVANIQQTDPALQEDENVVADAAKEAALKQAKEATDKDQSELVVAEGKESAKPAGKGNSGTSAPAADSSENTITYSGGIMLPRVTHGSSVQGSYSLYMLAAHEGYDCILPRVSGNIVTYYIVADGCNLEWQTYLDGSEAPTFLSETESLPYQSTISGSSDRSGEYGFTYITANSADGVYQAVAMSDGDDAGLHIIDRVSGIETLADIYGGGSLLSWSPDSNKVLYTQTDGSLHVYYPDQDLHIEIYSSSVSYVCWAGDSQHVVFSARNSESGQLAVYSVVVP